MQGSENTAIVRYGKIRRLRRWMAAMIGCHGHLLLPATAFILTLCSTWIILGPVLNRSGDNIYHLATEYALLHGIQAGDNPLGPIGMDFGQPILRFYQALYYLQNVVLHIVTRLDLMFLHNLTIVVCFALSPFSYAYFLRKLGLNRWAAGLGGMLSMISVAAFGNSFEAYHQAGIVTQSMGGLFFPWFAGNFIGMLRGENRASSTAMLFALAFLSHAIMSVFAVFAGVLYFLVSQTGLKHNLKRLTVFALIGSALVAFWVFPFIEHTNEKRAVPDSVTRGKGVHWFTSVSTSELNMVLTTGRLLDDPPVKGDARDANDRFMDKISIIGTLKTRPRAFTILTALGILVALGGIRRTSRRFLLGGFAFSLMLFTGPDDFRWLAYMPFIKHIQTFRCTYLIEFFAFGLAAVGLEGVLGTAFNFSLTRRRRLARYPLTFVWAVIAAAVIGLIGSEIILLGQTHMRVRNHKSLDRMVDACSSLPMSGYPYRISPKYKGRFKIRHGWLSKYMYHPYCTHWKGVGPTTMYNLCMSLGGPKRNSALYALAGIRWFTGQGDKIDPLFKAKDKSGVRLFHHLPNGKDRRKRPFRSHRLLDFGHDHFLRPLVGVAMPVVCNDKQWIWLTKSWTTRYRNRLWNDKTPIPMRVKAGSLGNSGLLRSAMATFYMDHDAVDLDREALAGFTAKGGIVISPVDIVGVDEIPLEQRSAWDLLPEEMKPIVGLNREEEREELDPGIEIAQIEMIMPRSPTYQHFIFDVDNIEPIVVVLPMEMVDGWSAVLDGEPISSFATGPDLVGVSLPRGAHRLSFIWKMPTRHWVMVFISLAALLFVAGVWSRAFWRRATGKRALS